METRRLASYGSQLGWIYVYGFDLYAPPYHAVQRARPVRRRVRVLPRQRVDEI